MFPHWLRQRTRPPLSDSCKGAERSKQTSGAWGDTETGRTIGGSDGQLRCIVRGWASPKREVTSK